MDMALKVDVWEACKAEGSDKPIDLVYLSSATMGDKSLEKELLGLFAAQLPHYVEALKNSGSTEELYRAAHTLKGAAKSVGAFKLSEIAESMEFSGKMEGKKLVDEISLVCSYISEIINPS